MVESEIESDSTKKNEFYQKKIERITDDYENQTRRKNQELDEIFEEITLENDNLRKELLLTKEELEGEIEKNIDIKNSIYNFNYFTKKTSKELDEKLGKDKNIKEDYTNSIFCDYLKTIKEESNKKLSELNTEQENNIKNFAIMSTSLENKINNIYNILKEDERMNIHLKDIIKELNIYNNKYNSLLSENYSNKKYIIILVEKLGLAREEIFFLKERIIKEKKIILEKINSLSHDNELTHITMIQEISNEISQKRKNYFNEQFFFPIQDLHKSFLEFKEKEKELVNKNEVLKKELEELKYKFNKVNEEKDEMMKNVVNYTINKENNKNNETYLQSMVNKLRKEKLILENENNSLLKNNSELNEQIISINNKIKFELNKKNNENLSLINQKDSLIRELNKKLNSITETNSKDKTTINNLNEEIDSLNNKINEFKNNENNFKSEILLLKKALKESNYKTTTMAQTNSLDSYNNTKKNQNILSEKKVLKNNLDNNYRNKNSELNTTNKDKFKLTSTEKSNEVENNLPQIIRKIYLNHISNEIDNNDEVYMLNEINNKLTQMETTSSNNNTLGNNQFIKMKIVYNEDFESLEQNKNSQLYENMLIYIFHLKSQQQIEINKILSNYISPSDNKNTKMLEFLDKLKIDLDEKCSKFEERIKHSVNVDEVEQLIAELKNFYEMIIDYIIKNFYKYKRDLSGNILTIQLPLDEYHRIINNTAANLSNIDTNIINKINEYKGQGNKIENAINILIDNVNNNLNG
jgi:hypothetical protein